MRLVRLKDKGDLRIPAEIRRELDLQDGDRLLIETQGEQLILTPLRNRVPYRQFLGRYAGRVREYGPLTPERIADAVAEDVRTRPSGSDA